MIWHHWLRRSLCLSWKNSLHGVGDLIWFWVDFMKAMQILLVNVRVKWQLHLQTQVGMLPYFFVADQQNCARWGTLYAIERLFSLPGHSSRSILERRNTWKVQGQYGVTWVWKWPLSKTIIIGLTRGTAVLRLTCTRHLLGQYAGAIRLRNGTQQTSGETHEAMHASHDEPR